MKPGEYLLNEEAGPLTINKGRKTTTLLIKHTGDRPVQVGSHYHFFEVNATLQFERSEAYGMRLDIPAGTAVRFEPGRRRKFSLLLLVVLVLFMGIMRRLMGHCK